MKLRSGKPRVNLTRSQINKTPQDITVTFV